MANNLIPWADSEYTGGPFAGFCGLGDGVGDNESSGKPLLLLRATQDNRTTQNAYHDHQGHRCSR